MSCKCMYRSSITLSLTVGLPLKIYTFKISSPMENIFGIWGGFLLLKSNLKLVADSYVLVNIWCFPSRQTSSLQIIPAIHFICMKHFRYKLSLRIGIFTSVSILFAIFVCQPCAFVVTDKVESYSRIFFLGVIQLGIHV